MHSSPSPSRLARKCRSSKQASEPSSIVASTAPQTVRPSTASAPRPASAAMLARWSTRFESLRWPFAVARDMQHLGAGERAARDQRVAPLGRHGLGPGGFEPRQRVGARAGDDRDRHGAGVCISCWPWSRQPITADEVPAFVEAMSAAFSERARDPPPRALEARARAGAHAGPPRRRADRRRHRHLLAPADRPGRRDAGRRRDVRRREPDPPPARPPHDADAAPARRRPRSGA